jgi:hypothetical protein
MHETMFMSRTAVLLVSLAISGCAGLPKGPPPGEVGIDGIACVGKVAEPVAGLSEIGNAALLTKAQYATGKGGVCSGKVFSVTAPVVLYRVFDASNPYSKYGGWWTLKRPSGPREDYRAANAICKEWSSLDRLVSCEVRPGTEVVIGTTQSAVCSDGSIYPKTAENQVFVPNDTRIGILHVGACGEELVWP